MSKFIPPFVFILSVFLFSFNTRWAIKGGTYINGWFWHLTQWGTIFGCVVAGILFGVWCRESWRDETFFHNFGEVMAVAVLAVGVYVFSLHYLTVRF